MGVREDIDFSKVDFGDTNYEEFMLWFMKEAPISEVQLWLNMGLRFDWEEFYSKAPNLCDNDPMIEELK